MPMSYKVLAFLRRSQFRSRTVPPELTPSICVCTAPDVPVVQRSLLPPDIMLGAIAVGGGCSTRVVFSLRLTFSLRLSDVDLVVLSLVEFTVLLLLNVCSPEFMLRLTFSLVLVLTLVLVLVDVFTFSLRLVLLTVEVFTLLLLNVCSPLLMLLLVLTLVLVDVFTLLLLLVLVLVDVFTLLLLLVLVLVDVLMLVLVFVAVLFTVVSLMLLLVFVLVLVDVTVLVLVDVLLVSTLVWESYCAVATVVTNAAVIPAIIFIVDILSAPRLFHSELFTGFVLEQKHQDILLVSVC